MKSVVEKFDALYEEAFNIESSSEGIRSLSIIIELMKEYQYQMIRDELISYSLIPDYTQKLIEVEKLQVKFIRNERLANCEQSRKEKEKL